MLTRSDLPSKWRSCEYILFKSYQHVYCWSSNNFKCCETNSIDVASGWMALSHYGATSGFSLTFGKSLLWLKIDWIYLPALNSVLWASHWPSLSLSFPLCKMEIKTTSWNSLKMFYFILYFGLYCAIYFVAQIVSALPFGSSFILVPLSPWHATTFFVFWVLPYFLIL